MHGMIILICAALMQLTQVSTMPATAPHDAQLAQALRKIDERALEVRDVTAQFQQSKYTAMLKKPMQSEGTLRIKADAEKVLMRWETTKPYPSTLITTDAELRIYFPNQSLLEVYPLESGLAQFAASPLPRLETARKHFRIEEFRWEGLDKQRAERHIALRLTPIEEELHKHVLEVRVLIDAETACIVNAEIYYPDDERLVLAFTDIRMNTGLQASDFELKVGPNVKVTRPLQPNSKDES